MQLIFAQSLFPNYIFSYLRQTYLTDTEIQRKIHLRERNRNFDRSNFPNSIVPLETKSIWFITRPTTTQTLRIVSVLHVRNRILRNQPEVGNRLLQRVPFFWLLHSAG